MLLQPFAKYASFTLILYLFLFLFFTGFNAVAVNRQQEVRVMTKLQNELAKNNKQMKEKAGYFVYFVICEHLQ